MQDVIEAIAAKIDVERPSLKELFETVAGAGGPEHFPILVLLNELLKRWDVKGSIAEIGVLHGNFLIMLAKLASEGERTVGLDVFSDQEFNADGAGVGVKEVVRANVDKFCDRPDDVDPIQTDSTALHSAKRHREFVDAYGEFKIFSIDGCHLKGHTISDIALGASVLANGGILLIDDYNNEGWPGVPDGTAAYFNFHNIRLAPLLICFNKLICTTISHHKIYYDALAEWIRLHGVHQWYNYYKVVPIYNHDVICIAQSKGMW